MMPPAGVDRACDEAARKQGTLDGLSDRSSHPIARHPALAAFDDEGRGPAAAIMRDQPVVIRNSFAGGHVVLRVPDLNRMIGSPLPGGFLARCLPGQALYR